MLGKILKNPVPVQGDQATFVWNPFGKVGLASTDRVAFDDLLASLFGSADQFSKQTPLSMLKKTSILGIPTESQITPNNFFMSPRDRGSRLGLWDIKESGLSKSIKATGIDRPSDLLKSGLFSLMEKVSREAVASKSKLSFTANSSALGELQLDFNPNKKEIRAHILKAGKIDIPPLSRHLWDLFRENGYDKIHIIEPKASNPRRQSIGVETEPLKLKSRSPDSSTAKVLKGDSIEKLSPKQALRLIQTVADFVQLDSIQGSYEVDFTADGVGRISVRVLNERGRGAIQVAVPTEKAEKWLQKNLAPVRAAYREVKITVKLAKSLGPETGMVVKGEHASREMTDPVLRRHPVEAKLGSVGPEKRPASDMTSSLRPEKVPRNGPEQDLAKTDSQLKERVVDKKNLWTNQSTISLSLDSKQLQHGANHAANIGGHSTNVDIMSGPASKKQPKQPGRTEIGKVPRNGPEQDLAKTDSPLRERVVDRNDPGTNQSTISLSLDSKQLQHGAIDGANIGANSAKIDLMSSPASKKQPKQPGRTEIGKVPRNGPEQDLAKLDSPLRERVVDRNDPGTNQSTISRNLDSKQLQHGATDGANIGANSAKIDLMSGPASKKQPMQPGRTEISEVPRSSPEEDFPKLDSSFKERVVDKSDVVLKTGLASKEQPLQPSRTVLSKVSVPKPGSDEKAPQQTKTRSRLDVLQSTTHPAKAATAFTAIEMEIESVGRVSVLPKYDEGEIKLAIETKSEKAREWLQNKLRHLGFNPRNLKINFRASRVDGQPAPGAQVHTESKLAQLQALHRIREIYNLARQNIAEFTNPKLSPGEVSAPAEPIASTIAGKLTAEGEILLPNRITDNAPNLLRPLDFQGVQLMNLTAKQTGARLQPLEQDKNEGGTSRTKVNRVADSKIAVEVKKALSADEPSDSRTKSFRFKTGRQEPDEPAFKEIREFALAPKSGSNQPLINGNSINGQNPLWQLMNGKLGTHPLERGQLPEMIQKIVEMTNTQSNLTNQKLEVQLEIDRLGNLLIDAVKQQGKVNLRISVESSAVQRLIETQLRPMIDQMVKDGIEFGKLEVSVRDSKQQGQNENHSGRHSSDFSEQRRQRSRYDWNHSAEKAPGHLVKRNFGYNSVELWA